MNKIIVNFVIVGMILTCGSVAVFGQKNTKKTSPQTKNIAAKSKSVKKKTVGAKRRKSKVQSKIDNVYSRPSGAKVIGVMDKEPPRPMSILAPAPAPKFSEPAPKFSDSIKGGIVNGKARDLVTPQYPPQAKAVNASGQVSVQVLIDENGDVVSATAVSGHPLLRAAALQAARASTFSPTLLSGQPVKVSGTIIYNFTPK